MNDKTEDRPDEPTSPGPETSADGEPAGEPLPPAVVRRSGTGIALLALLVALAAGAGAGYVWYEQQAQKLVTARLGDLENDVERSAKDVDRLLDAVDELARVDRELDDDVTSLTAQLDERFAAVPERLAKLESTIAKVPGISQKARAAWLRSEAEYFLRVANAQLNLAGNVGVSLRALELADEQLRDLADPALTPVRAAIANERAALKAVPQPDAEGIVLTLGSLARRLDTLPFADVAPGSYRGESGAVDPAETGWRRAWRSIVDALRSIVSVKRDDEQIEPLLTGAQEAMLVRSLDADLQIARLAVIRNERELYRNSLDTVRNRLRAYFDMESPEVASALATLEELGEADLPEELPDISTSLRLLLNAPGGATEQ